MSWEWDTTCACAMHTRGAVPRTVAASVPVKSRDLMPIVVPPAYFHPPESHSCPFKSCYGQLLEACRILALIKSKEIGNLAKPVVHEGHISQFSIFHLKPALS